MNPSPRDVDSTGANEVVDPKHRRAIARLKYVIAFSVPFLLACVLLFIVEHIQEFTHAVINAGLVHQRLVINPFRGGSFVSDIAIVDIRSGREPMEVTLVNVCQQRLFLSRVLRVIAQAGPAVVVIDKYFSPDACPMQPEGTKQLQATIRDLLAKRIPVVVGRRINEAGFVEPALSFPRTPDGRTVVDGALTFDINVNRVRFVWPNLSWEDGSKGYLETLGYRAALAKTPNLARDNTRLARFYSSDMAPFIAFLPSASLNNYSFSAIRLLCGSQTNQDTDWRTCDRPDHAIASDLHGRVVLIGEETLGFDQHATELGPLSGVRLHANYIEAILSNNLFYPVPLAVTILYNFAFLVMIQVLIFQRRSTWLFGVIGLVVLSYLLSWFVVQLFGFYLNPGLTVVGVLMTQLLHGWSHKFIERA